MNSPEVRCACLDQQPLLGDNHCLCRRVQLANKHSRMESRFPLSSSWWLGRLVQDLLSEFQNGCVVPSAMQPLQRCLSVAADVTLVRQVRSKFHQPAKYPCVRRDSGPNAMLQRSLQSSGLTSHESHCTFDDPVGLAFSHCWSPPGQSGFPLGPPFRAITLWDPFLKWDWPKLVSTT